MVRFIIFWFSFYLLGSNWLLCRFLDWILVHFHWGLVSLLRGDLLVRAVRTWDGLWRWGTFLISVWVFDNSWGLNGLGCSFSLPCIVVFLDPALCRRHIFIYFLLWSWLLRLSLDSLLS